MSATILLLGVPDEPPLALAASALRDQGLPFLVWDQRRIAASRCEVWIDDQGMGGLLECPDWRLPLDQVAGAYTRLAAWPALPELEGRADDDPLVAHAAALHQALDAWLESTPARVVNRSAANDSNNSKPFQALCIRQHFFVPDTLVTNDPQAALAFCQAHARTIYKSISGERSIVTEFGPADLERLPLLRNAPLQLQALVEGFDVRVHVVGDTVFATRILSTAIDYRYDHSSSGAAFSAFELPSDVAEACVQLAREMALGLAGIDLRFAPDGRVYCFEVNPSPAYSAFESETGQPISRALAAYLAGA